MKDLNSWLEKRVKALEEELEKSKRDFKFFETCTALVVGCDDVASCYSVGVLTRRQVGS